MFRRIKQAIDVAIDMFFRWAHRNGCTFIAATCVHCGREVEPENLKRHHELLHADLLDAQLDQEEKVISNRLGEMIGGETVSMLSDFKRAVCGIVWIGEKPIVTYSPYLLAEEIRRKEKVSREEAKELTLFLCREVLHGRDGGPIVFTSIYSQDHDDDGVVFVKEEETEASSK